MAEKEKLRQEFLDELQNKLVRASCTDEIYALLAEAAAWLTASEGLSFLYAAKTALSRYAVWGNSRKWKV